jgi:hypothetical protein
MPAALAEPLADTLPFGPPRTRAPWVYDLDVCDRCGGLSERGHCSVCEPGLAVERRSRREQRQELWHWPERIDPVGEQARRAAIRERDAEAQRRREQVREQARLRPAWVFVRVEGGDQEPVDDDSAVLWVPKEASYLVRKIAEIAAHEASIRLSLGDSLEFAVGWQPGPRPRLAPGAPGGPGHPPPPQHSRPRPRAGRRARNPAPRRG